MAHIDFGVTTKCYAFLWSYGEICVKCNCCGRFDKDKEKIRKARLRYHRACLKEDKEFDNWITENPQLLAVQKKNVAASIAYNQKMIARYRKK